MNSFHIILPSNTDVEGNKTNSFKIRLPHKLHFNSQWVVGLTEIVYPYSWHTLGTNSKEYFKIFTHDNFCLNVEIPSLQLMDFKELETIFLTFLNEKLKEINEKLTIVYNKLHATYSQVDDKIIRAIQTINNSIVSILTNQYDVSNSKIDIKNLNEKVYFNVLTYLDKNLIKDIIKFLSLDLIKDFFLIDGYTDELKKFFFIICYMNTGSLEVLINSFNKSIHSLSINFNSLLKRFDIKFNKNLICNITFSNQLSYIMGLNTLIVNNNIVSKYPTDITGGISSICVYAPNLIAPVIVGDVTAPLLRLVNVKGKPFDIIENKYITIQYHKLLTKEISEICIDIRTNDGYFVPFNYGTCTLTLHFKKIPYF